jgi:serine/threonine protein kinase
MTQQEFRKRFEFNISKDSIGGGSFGTVYKAYDTILDREVAIKVSEVKKVSDKEAKKMLDKLK